MAEIQSSVASDLVGSLASLAIEELNFLRGIPSEIKRLQERLERILPVLDNPDARRCQNPAFDAFVKQLSGVVYDAVDVVEEHMLEKEKNKNKSSVLSSLTCSGALGIRRHKLGNKIRGINQKIDDIVKDIPILPNLIPSGPSDRTDSEKGISHRTSPSVEPDLVGERMEEDATMLVNMLVSKDGDRNRSKISVFAIVGMGGIGKTTLAQKIINDERLKAKFRSVKPIWVCVSQDFSEIDLLRAIVRGFGVHPGEVKDKSVLESMVREIVKGKRFFLVLDDVWDARVWEELLHKPLQGCSARARVLVTTRDETVARRMRAVHRHQVEKLFDEDGWLLIRKMVLPDNNEDARDYSENLRGVGMMIVKKCDGLPLALKSIAGVLRSKEPTQRHWEEVLQNLSRYLTERPEGASGVLYLSYAELPSPLKKCLLYFALFPEDYEYRRAHIIGLWIAEGFVQTKESMLMGELVRGYWDELVQRSLLQPNDAWYDSMVCKMHDLLHSLARSLASEECLCLDMPELGNNSTFASSSRMRRLYMKDGVKSISDVITEHAFPRTLKVPFLVKFTKRDATRLRCLRILDISGSSIENLLNSIGDLTHLRYLNLTDTAISKLPESIGRLANLQFLILDGCSN